MSATENLDNEDRSWWLSSLIWWSTLATIRFKFWNSQSKYKNQHNQISAKNSQSCLPSCILVELVFKHQEYTSWTIKPPNVLFIFYSWYLVKQAYFLAGWIFSLCGGNYFILQVTCEIQHLQLSSLHCHLKLELRPETVRFIEIW